MYQAPFAAAHELYHKLYLSSDSRSIQRQQSYPTGDTTNSTPTCKTYLPGQPRISLENGSAVGEYLAAELITKDLNQLASHLWLVATQDSSHISSLTHQIVRGREIIITEKPELHLVWIYDRVYIKPIPKYLLSHAFWTFYLTDENLSPEASAGQGISKAAVGFLRSYAYLIRHKSDFTLASEKQLIPKGIKHAAFINFITNFEHIGDQYVSPRYQYGELRLSRLNFWTKIFLRRFAFHKVHDQYGAYFGRFYGPILFVFGVFSLALSAMQLALRTAPSQNQTWPAFTSFTRGFSICTLVCVAGVALSLLFLFLALGIREIVFALKAWYHKTVTKLKDDEKAKTTAARITTPKSLHQLTQTDPIDLSPPRYLQLYSSANTAPPQRQPQPPPLPFRLKPAPDPTPQPIFLSHPPHPQAQPKPHTSPSPSPSSLSHAPAPSLSLHLPTLPPPPQQKRPKPKTRTYSACSAQPVPSSRVGRQSQQQRTLCASPRGVA